MEGIFWQNRMETARLSEHINFVKFQLESSIIIILKKKNAPALF